MKTTRHSIPNPNQDELENLSAALLFFGNAISSAAQCGRLDAVEAGRAEVLLNILIDRLDATWNPDQRLASTTARDA